MYDIFLSYAREDELQVSILESALEEVGWRVFRDFDMKAGDSITERISDHVASARVVLICWSAAVNSDWVKHEAEMAGEKYLSVTLDGVRPPPPFADSLAPNFRNWIGGQRTRSFRALVRGLANRLGWPSGTEPENFDTWLDMDRRQKIMANLFLTFGTIAAPYGASMWIASQNGGRTPINILTEEDRIKGFLIALVLVSVCLLVSQIALARFAGRRLHEHWSLRVPWFGLSPPRRSPSNSLRIGLILTALALLPFASTVHFTNILTDNGTVARCGSHELPTGPVRIDPWRHVPMLSELWGDQTYCFGGGELREVSDKGVFFAPTYQPIAMTILMGFCWLLFAVNVWLLFGRRLSQPR